MSSDFHFATERVFFEMAEAHYQEALLHAGKVRRRIAPRRYRTFDGFPTDEGLGFAIAAIVSWAIAIETSVNHLYSRHVILKMKSGPHRRRARQNMNAVDRLNQLLRGASINTSQLSWWQGVVDLFHFRDELIQVKETTTGDATIYTPTLRMRLSEDLLEDTCMTASLALAKLGEVYAVPTAYLNKGPLGLMLNRPESWVKELSECDRQMPEDIPF